MDIGRYLKIGLHWWWLVLVSVALSATASYFYSRSQPKIYAARTTLRVGLSVAENTRPDPQDWAVTRGLAESYAELALRRPVTQAVIDRLGLEMDPDTLSQMIQTNIIPNAQLLEIFVMDVHPGRAKLIADAVADALIQQSPGGSEAEQKRNDFIKSQLEELQVKINDTTGKIEGLENSLRSLTSAAEIAEAQSQLTQLETLNNAYLNNYNQLLSQISGTPNQLTVTEPAVEPTASVAPNIKMNVLIAAVAGLVLALSAIVLLEFFSDTLTWQMGETQSVLGWPVLGAIGKVADSANKIVDPEGTWSPEADTLRTLRSSVMLAAEGRSLTTLLITSCLPGEGKSFLAANLAVTVAASGSSLAAVIATAGSRVILVDADLRKPLLHEMFDMPNLLGLADILAMPEVMIAPVLKKALRTTSIDNLQLLLAGRSPIDPGALLNSTKFKGILEALKTQADIVIIDSGPLLRVVETRAIANMVDGIVLVVNNGRTRRQMVQQALDYLKNRQDRNNLLGIVFNRVKIGRSYDYYTRSASQRHGGQSQQLNTATLSLAEVTDYLGVSEETARRWCEQGRLLAVKNGRRWSVRLEDLNEFIGAYQSGGSEISKAMREAATPVEDEDLS